MIKRIFIGASIILPAIFLLLFWRFPHLDPVWHNPILHFYLVTFFTFTAAVVSFFTMIMLGQHSPPRHRLMITAAAAMGVIFFIHGVTTPGALILTFNPGVVWAAWLTLFVGGGLFALAALDTPDEPLSLPQLRRIDVGVAILIGGFALVVAFRPSWLTMIEGQLGAWWPQQVIFGLTLLAWIWATWRLWRIWRRTGDRVDGIMALNAAWLALAAVSMHLFPTWQLSWWLYHILLLMATTTAVFSLAQQYERIRRFRLTPYYAATSLIVTAALALLASYLFAQVVQRTIVQELSRQSIQVGRNLAANVVGDMPEAGDQTSLSAVLDDTDLNLAARLARHLTGLEVGVVNVYDAEGALLFGMENALLPHADEVVALADDAGTATYRVLQSDRPLYPDAGANTYLETMVPIRPAEGENPAAPMGMLLTVQALPGLEAAIVEARLNGLLIAGASMGLLFLALLGIVRRSDRLITARTNELAQAYADLQEAEAMRDDLTDMIVHDLRSPLTTIKLNLSLLQKTLDDPEKAAFRTQFIENAGASVQRMLRLINDLLDVARLEGGQLQLSRSPLPIRPLLQEQAALHTPRAESSEKVITVMAPEALPAPPADPDLIGRVLDNLITNALKYTRKGGRITLRARQKNASLLIQVEDDGEGMTPEQAAHVFDKFYQVKDASGKPRRGGAGLGLAFCKLVVEAHNGRIWAESEQGVGSLFSFTLPLAPPQDEG